MHKFKFREHLNKLSILVKPIIQLGYLILLFIEKLFIPLQNAHKFASKTLNNTYKDLDYYIAQFSKNYKVSFKTGISKLKSLQGRKVSIQIKIPALLKKSKSYGKLVTNDVWVPDFVDIKKKAIKQKGIGGLAMFLLGILFASIFGFFPYLTSVWFKELPSPDLLVTKTQSQPTKILDRKGRLLYEIYVDYKYEPIKLEAVPEKFIQATIAAEDDKFYSHMGFDIESMMRAVRATLVDDNLQGASTITQQLIKNVLLSQERTIARKTKEIVLAVLVELKYSKEQILELYLNNISYGGTTWGVQSAAQKYFGKNVSELDLAESSLLAGMTSAPSAYSPLGGNLFSTKVRQKYVLDRMVTLNYITQAEADAAYAEELTFAEQSDYIRAPHFVAHVREELDKKYGRRFVEFGGLTITTTLDLDLQDQVQKIVSEEVAKSSNLLISNGAAVVLDPQSAEILAYVGSVDYFKDGWGAFDVANGNRQPGSSIKPVTYALALENGETPATILKDTPVTYKIEGQEPYTPKNYDGKYHGNVSLRTALANSYNIPAVRLAAKYGPDKIVELGKSMGLRTWEVDGNYGLSVTLGGKEVSLLDLTNTYSTFARKGSAKEITPFLSIKDGNGFDIYNSENRSETKVLSEETAYLIWHILSDNNARRSTFGSNSKLEIKDKTVAVKTGTTDQIRDNYTVGFTPSYAVGVWVGNNDNSPLHRTLASGISGAAPMWNRIMSLVLEGKPDERMERPENVIVKEYKECGKSEVFDKDTKIPDTICGKNGNGNKKDD